MNYNKMMDPKDIKNILKGAMVDANKEAEATTTQSAQVVEFKSNSSAKLKDDLADWSNKDFAVYIKQSYKFPLVHHRK